MQAAAELLDDEVANATSARAALESIGCPRMRMKEASKLLAKIRNINHRKSGFERGFISTEGLPRRPWYKHLAVSPGELLGYGATTFPGGKSLTTIAKAIGAI